MVNKRYVITILLVAGAPAGVLCAQDSEPKRNVFVQTSAGGDVGFRTFQFVGPEAMIPGRVIKGAPYSATAVTETVQTLNDGNRITETASSFLARDSEGRTRREQSLPSIGPWASEGPATKLVTINDPVSGATYMLDDGLKTARKLPNVEPLGAVVADKIQYDQMVHVQTQPGPAPGEPHVVTIRKMVSQAEKAALDLNVAPKQEKLGHTTIEGVTAQGVRTTTVMPAGAVGNERPITITDERWYSPELQTTVLSKHSDPRTGETTFRLTNISRSEPAATLFQVPADYEMDSSEEPGEIKIEKR